MGVNGRNSRDNLVQIEIKGRNQPTNKNKKGNTVYRINKGKPIRYTLEELRQIKRKVESNDKYKILETEVCYRIRKLGLDRLCGKKKKLSKQKVKEERGILRSNLIEIKTAKCLGLDMTSRRFTIMLSNVQSIKNKQDIVMELLEDYNTNLAVLTETWLTDADDIWV